MAELWNYAVVKETLQSKTLYSIRKVYYTEDGTAEYCDKDAVHLQFEQLQDVSDNLIYILGALTRPVVDLDKLQPSVKESVNQALEMLRNND
jgi:DNA topoisomerase VI subunit A